MKTLQDFVGQFRQALENTVERGHTHNSEYGISEVSSVGYPYQRGGLVGRALSHVELQYQTPYETFKQIGEGFKRYAEAIQTLADNMDEFNKRLAIVESLLTLGDDKQTAIEEKIKFIVSEVKRLVDAYIEEEIDSHLIGRKINWKLRCNKDKE